ncbi:hypothetical protein [Sphingobacterium multivorum]|uniref:hypothetical protein n=1 Tax=Sphingobacterium multivorum TaxID=28454 RepID=UPI0031BA46B1
MDDLYYKTEEYLIRIRSCNNKFINYENISDKAAPHYVLKNNPIANQFSGYRLIQKDLQNILETINYTVDHSNSTNYIVNRSLSFFIAVTYAKCFTTAEGRKIKLEEKQILKVFNDEQRDLHYQLMTFRNQYVAHGGNSQFEMNPIAISIFGESFAIHDNLIYVNNLKIFNNSLKEMIIEIIKEIEKKLSKIYDRLGAFVLENFKDIQDNSFTPDLTKLIEIKDM